MVESSAFLALIVAVVAWFTQNLAWGFAIGVILHYGGMAVKNFADQS